MCLISNFIEVTYVVTLQTKKGFYQKLSPIEVILAKSATFWQLTFRLGSSLK